MKPLLEILSDLVSFESVTAQPNRDIADYIHEYLAARGAKITKIPGTDADTYGIVASFGPKTDRGAVLSGHMDVVPVTGQHWTRPPFALTREDDRLYGRGTTDMKGFLACMLDAADRASRAELRAPFKLVFSYDEEIGCVGIQQMLPALRDVLGAPDVCIVGEPTNMKVAVGHKGKTALKATCFGEAGHSALAPQFVNAIHLATDFVSGLREFQARFAQGSAQDPAYDIPYSTIHVGRIEGGRALNIVPEQADILFEIRNIASDAPGNLMAEIEEMAQTIAARYPDKGRIVLETITSYPGLNIAPDDAAARLCQRLSPVQDITKVAFGTEAGVFQSLGIPSIVCGPGSMAGQGHKADEYIELSELAACSSMMDRLLEDLRT